MRPTRKKSAPTTTKLWFFLYVAYWGGVLLVETGWNERIVDLLAVKGYQLVDLIWWDVVHIHPCL